MEYCSPSINSKHIYPKQPIIASTFHKISGPSLNTQLSLHCSQLALRNLRKISLIPHIHSITIQIQCLITPHSTHHITYLDLLIIHSISIGI